jgi:hypothetical protein
MNNNLTGYRNTRLSVYTGPLMSCLFFFLLERSSAGKYTIALAFIYLLFKCLAYGVAYKDLYLG